MSDEVWTCCRHKIHQLCLTRVTLQCRYFGREKSKDMYGKRWRLAKSWRKTLQSRIRTSNRVCSWWPCCRSKTIKSICIKRKLFSQWKRILLFSLPAWPLRTHSVNSIHLPEMLPCCIVFHCITFQHNVVLCICYIMLI